MNFQLDFQYHFQINHFCILLKFLLGFLKFEHTFQQLFPRKVYEDDPVIIIDIDDRSLELVGQWPWSRTTLARLTDQTYAAAALGFDIVFAEPDRTNPRNLIDQFPNNLALKLR